MELFKGFNRDLTCRGFQYKEGKTYEEREADLCSAGFHACENPIDCFGYYAPATSVYHSVDLDGVTDQHSNDTKRVGTKITIGAEIGLRGVIEGAIKFVFERTDWKKGNSVSGDQAGAQATGYQAGAQATGYQAGAQATGYHAGAQATGYQAGAQATGDQAGAQATGYQAGAQATGYQAGAQATGVMACASAVGVGSTAFADGKHAVACAIGAGTKAKGTIGAWLVIAERGEWNGNCYPIITVKTEKVDGEKIKPETWYKLENGEFVACK